MIYLRARYYDPSVSRFVQIDNNYDGEKQSVASQNKYVYTMNNPYKYVDKDGNKATKNSSVGVGAIGGIAKIAANTAVKVATKAVKTVVNVVVGFFSPSTAKNINKAIDNASKMVTSFINGIGGNSSKKGGGSQSSKPPVKKVKVEAKCPEKTQSSNSGLDLLQNILDLIGWIPGIGDICDGINAVIYYLRGMTILAISSIACILFASVADSIIKPLKAKFAKNIDRFAALLAEFIPKITSQITKFGRKLANQVSGIWLVGGSLSKGITSLCDKFDLWIAVVFQKSFTKSSLQIGQQMHKEYKADIANQITKVKEYILPSKKRIDFIDFDNKIIYELKPFNPTQVGKGSKQLEGYLKEISELGKTNEKFSGVWKTVLDTY